MICIYKQDNNNYTNNGDAVLIPTVCDLAMTINGAWQLKITHPYDPEERYKLITEGAIIRIELECIAELETVYQLFRVYQYTKGLHSIEAIAFPVAMESTYDAPIDNLVISGKTGAQAMAQLQTFTNKYTLSSDVTATGSSSYNNTNINEAIASGNDNSFIQVWGGEILYDNYKFKVKTRLGDDTAGDHRVMYGRNLTNIEYEKDDSGIITRISPISQDNIRLDGTGYVDSSHISDYPVAHHKYETAPYTLVDTEATSPSQTATLTRQAVAAVSAQADTLSHSAWTTASGAGYQPEYIKSIKTEITEAVQNMALANVVSTSLYNLMKTTIANAMAWLGDLKQPKWEWMGSDQTGWKYGNATSYAKNMYVKIGKTWSYFGSDGNWQEPKDDSDEWNWHDVKNGTGKKYGNFNKYFAHNEYVYITQSGTIKEYWFNEQGWFEEDESGDSEYYWHGSGTGADPYWFGKDSSTYLKSCWRFIDGTYYFFDSYGYVAAQKDNYQWDWVESGDASRAWFGNAINSEYGSDGSCLKSQWEKINGTWYYFNSDGIVQSEAVSQTNAIAVFTTGMSGLTTTVDNWKGQLYSLLYSLMRSYCTWRYKQKIDLPAITIKVDMADLSKTEEYKDFADLEKIRLGDSVECIDYEHNISTTNRVIGITYDCILKSNKDITIGEAAATVAQMVGNAQGEAVTGGFDTSALETQLTALRNGKQDKLTAGDNITIENNVISATGGNEGIDVYYGEVAPNNNIGANKDFYLRIGQIEYGTISDQSYTVTTVTLDSFSGSNNEYDIELSGNPGGGWDTILFQIAGLEEDSNYVVSFDIQFGQGTTFAHGTYGNWSQVFYSSSPSGNYDIDPARTDAVVVEHNLDLQHCSYVFTAGETNYLAFGFQNCKDGQNFSVTVSNLTISNGEASDRIKAIYNKHEGEWLKYEDDSLIASDIYYDNSISGLEATNTQTAIDEVCGNIIEVEANPSGTATTELTKLGIDGAIYDIPVGSEVEANPSGTATTTLNKIEIDGVIYDLPSGGGGGGGFDATELYSGTSYSGNITLSEPYTNFDYILFTGYATAGTGYLQSNLYKVEDLLVNNNIGVADDGNFSWWKITSTTTLTNNGSLGTYYVKKVYGLKASGGGGGAGGGAVTLYKATDSTHQNVQLSDSWTNYEALLVTMCSPNPTADASTSFTVNVASIVDGFIVGQGMFGYNWYRTFPSNATDIIEYWIDSGSSYYIDSVVGIKPGSGGGGEQQQADWAQTDSTAVDYIKNKPTVPEVEANPSGTASATLSTLEVDGTIYNVPSGGGSDLPLTVENGKLCIIYET